MRETHLLSNGTYHLALTAGGGRGGSRWNDLALTRRREDAALDESGLRLCLGEASSGARWPMHDAETWVRTANGALASSSVHDQIEAHTEIAVARDADVELRRVTLTNRSNRTRTLAATSLAELALAPPATDSAHPAFNKLFVVTEIDAGAILATRRPSSPKDTVAWFFHQAAVSTARSGTADVSFETDRMRFIGRGRTAGAAAAMERQGALGGHDGPVLDPIAAIRVPLRLEPGERAVIDWLTGIAATRADCVALARRGRADGFAEAVLAQAGAFRRELLDGLHATDADAARFERLAGSLLYADAALRAEPEEIASNRRGQSALWSFGISGDVPIVFAEVTGAGQLELVRQWARAHAFWAAHGLRAEMLIAAGADGAAEPSLADAVKAAITDGGGAERIGKPGGIFVRDGTSLDAADRTLMRSAARIVSSRTAVDLAGELDRDRPVVPDRPPAISTRTPASAGELAAAAEATTRRMAGLSACNGHGGFSADAREYVITTSATRMTPLPWSNVIANPTFGTLVSESGSATTWSENAHEFRLTPWSNDPVSDPNAEAFYIRDEASGRFWSPTLLPAGGELPYVVRHGFGYSVFEHAEDGIESTLSVSVAIDAPVKFSVLRLSNRSNVPRRLSVTGVVDWVLGDERPKTLMHVVTGLDAETGAIFARNGYQTDFPDRTAFFAVEGAERSLCGDRGDFFGLDGTRAAPAAMAQARLSGRLGAALDPCAAWRIALDLAPGESHELVFRLGAGQTPAEARDLVRRTRGAEAAPTALAAVHAFWERTLGRVQVRTPDAGADALANGWLVYQVIAARLWGRTGFYQSSGAYGFRDQLQDVMALVHAAPDLVREHLLRSASRQFVEGDVQHWWHPPAGKGVRTRCSDDYLWLPLAASRYVETTGDAGVLDVACPFLESAALKDDEQSRYESPTAAVEAASLYEHCRRAIRHGLRHGVHGLPLMGAGDWNDGMNLVGEGGRGESVWLGFFLVTVLQRFAPLARERGDLEFAATCDDAAARLKERIEASAWDGDWYLRAWFDDGTPLGSAASAECQIDAIAQSWAVISGTAPAERGSRAMAALERRLMPAETRIVRLLDPPFDTSEPSPGYIQGYVPGVRENGGQYTHGAVWAGLAFAALGDADRAWKVFDYLNPVRHADTAEHVAAYKTEPYVMAGDVYAFAPHAGRGGWSWYTGSAGWMVQLLLEALLGFQRRGDRLALRPLLPRGWTGFELRYRHGRSTYEIACRAAASAEAAGLTVDGARVADSFISLVDDDATHTATVAVWREPA